MRSLIYLFMAIVSLSFGAMVYFGLAFSPIEAGLLALAVGLACWIGFEMTARRRAQARIEKAIEDLSRLHSQDSLLNQSLTDKLDALLARDLGTRADVLEADVSVLGTVVRQVAETLSSLEEHISPQPTSGPPDGTRTAGLRQTEPDPVIPAEMLGQALDENRLIFHMQPIVTLPQRRAHGYGLVPRLMMEDGELADPPDFMPRPDGQRLIVRIERLLMETAITIVRRARTMNEPVLLFVPLTGATLADAAATEQAVGVLDANRAIAAHLVLSIEDTVFRNLATAQRNGLEAMLRKGVALCIDDARSLRFDFADISRVGVKYVKVDVHRFITVPHTLTDFHSADVAAFLARSGISLIARNVTGEDQILSLLDDGVGFAEGRHIAAPSPIRADLLVDLDEDEPDTPIRQINR